MDRERKLAHIVSYYFSRFDKVGIEKLGFKTDKEAFSSAAAALGLVPNYLKFRRDEFDVVHPHRKGWYQRQLSLNITNTIEALCDLSEPVLRGIVQDILATGKSSHVNENLDQVVLIFPDSQNLKSQKSRQYVPRNITGRKAEEIFIKWLDRNHLFGEHSTLSDVRDTGCGYDFEISDGSNRYFIEVKGLSTNEGGVMFTNKEWETAQDAGDKYFLALISDVNGEPVVRIIENPANMFEPVKTISTVIQVNWTLSKKVLNDSIHISASAKQITN